VGFGNDDGFMMLSRNSEKEQQRHKVEDIALPKSKFEKKDTLSSAYA